MNLIHLQLTVVQGDITNITADALVHPTNTSIAMMGEVGQALEKRGGKEFLEEVHDLRSSHGSLDSTTGRVNSITQGCTDPRHLVTMITRRIFFSLYY
jgi:O-acetyl-ADP-ribose deacetylase (regulator of RNase III)